MADGRWKTVVSYGVRMTLLQCRVFVSITGYQRLPIHTDKLSSIEHCSTAFFSHHGLKILGREAGSRLLISEC